MSDNSTEGKTNAPQNKRETYSRPEKPPACKINFGNIPQELKDREQWVCWDFRWRNGKWTKSPFKRTGKPAESDNSATWTNFDNARSYWKDDGERRGEDFSGIGYVFAEDDGYCGVDLDDCIDPQTQQVKPWGKDIIDRLSSYTEISPSGTGVKIWLKASKPSNDRSRTKFEDGEIEMHDRGRYFAMTGLHWPGTPATIEERQAEVDALYHKIFAKPEKEKPRKERPRTQTPHGETRSLADDELISKATAAKNGAKFARLFAGDTSDYNGDESAADQAFCNLLAFWTDKDKSQMDRILRSSGLYRGKWDEKRGETTYGQRTIDEACDHVSETYKGSRRRGVFGSPSKNGGNSDRRPSKPTVILGTDEYRVNDEVIEALSDTEAAPEVYQRGSLLVRVIFSQKVGKQSRLDRPEGTPRIAAMPNAFLCELLTRIADFFRVKYTQEGKEFVPAHPPDRTVATVLVGG